MADGCSRWESEEERKCSLVKISKISSASVNYSGVCLNNSHENDELELVAKSGDFLLFYSLKVITGWIFIDFF